MRSLLLIFLCALVSLPVLAQSLPPTATEPFWVMRDGEIVGQMVLDTACHRSLMQLEKQHQRDMDAVMASDSLTEPVRTKRSEVLNAEFEAGVRKLMTPEQFAQWTALTGMEHRNGTP